MQNLPFKLSVADTDPAFKKNADPDPIFKKKTETDIGFECFKSSFLAFIKIICEQK